MTDLPPLMRDQRKADADHLRLLAIFHFIVAGFSILGLGFLFLHYSFMHVFFANPAMWKDAKGGPPPQEIFAMFTWFYGFMAAVFLIAGLLNLLSGLFLRARRHRMFSLVVAGFDILQFPFGSTLAVFTFIVLLRDSVRELYEHADAGRAPGGLP